MTEPSTETNLEKLHEAMVADIKAQFPALGTVEFYREESGDGGHEKIQCPAVLLELTEWDEDETDPGTGQLQVQARFEARIIMGFRTPKVKLAMRVFAAAFCQWLRLRRWSNPDQPGKKIPTDPVQRISAAPDSFNPDLDKYEVWKVEWSQGMRFGADEWTNDGTVPGNVFVSFGPGNGDPANYEQIVGQP